MERKYERPKIEVQLIIAEGGVALSSQSFQTGKDPESLPDIVVWDVKNEYYDIEL